MRDTTRTMRAFLLVLACAATTTAQTRWTSIASTPPSLADFGMAYDEARQTLVMHGGWNHAFRHSARRTWLWTGGSWSSVGQTGVPERESHRMVYDPRRQRIVLFGGAKLSGPYGDTWEWDGSRWHEVRPATAPSPRSHHAMWFDAKRGKVLLFGGFARGTSYNDTWAWDGSTWTRLWPSTSPSPRQGMEVVYDLVRQRAVMFGPSAETWEWDGTTWLQRFPANTPPPRLDAAMAYHLARRRTVFFGGGSFGNERNDTWEWDGTDWRQLRPRASPAARAQHRMVYDIRRRRILLHGGQACYIDCSGLSGLWEFTSVDSGTYTAYGTGCATTAGPLGLRQHLGSVPWIGDTLELNLEPLPATPGLTLAGVMGRSNSSWGGQPLPFSLAPLGAFGCSLYASPDVPVALKGSVPTGRWTVPIPMSTGLVGQPFFLQGFVLGDPSNPARLAASNGGKAVIGVR